MPTPNALTIRLKNFTVKSVPVLADILYLGNSADNLNEAQCTVASLLSVLTSSPIVTPSISFNTNTGIIATTSNTPAPAGSVGERKAQSVLSTAPVAITSGVSANISSLVLEAGEWEISGNVGSTSSVSMSEFNAWCSLTSATLPDANQRVVLSTITGNIYGMCTPLLTVYLATTTPVFLSINATFSGTGIAYGQIQASRPR